MDLHVWSHPPTKLYISSYIEIRQGFLSPLLGEGRNLPIPITLAIGFYNSLHYRAIRDQCNTNCPLFNEIQSILMFVRCFCNDYNGPAGGERERKLRSIFAVLQAVAYSHCWNRRSPVSVTRLDDAGFSSLRWPENKVRVTVCVC